MLSSDASLAMWATDGGRRADSSTRFPGASSIVYVSGNIPEIFITRAEERQHEA
jgi:hypothetical protein